MIDTENVTEDELDELHKASVRGLQINMDSSNNVDKIVASVKANIAVAKSRDWVVQIWVPLSAMTMLYPIIESSEVTCVNHFVHTEVGPKVSDTMNASNRT